MGRGLRMTYRHGDDYTMDYRIINNGIFIRARIDPASLSAFQSIRRGKSISLTIFADDFPMYRLLYSVSEIAIRQRN
jgi:hypothetical protein